jgi:hypothetical protein
VRHGAAHELLRTEDVLKNQRRPGFAGNPFSGPEQCDAVSRKLRMACPRPRHAERRELIAGRTGDDQIDHPRLHTERQAIGQYEQRGARVRRTVDDVHAYHAVPTFEKGFRPAATTAIEIQNNHRMSVLHLFAC